jgi:hypothetical protein
MGNFSAIEALKSENSVGWRPLAFRNVRSSVQWIILVISALIYLLICFPLFLKDHSN